MKNHKIYIVIFLFSIITSCYEQQKYPPEPRIDFRMIVVEDTINPDLGNKEFIHSIYFKIIDGDNNFGVDTTEEYYDDSLYKENIFIDIYYQENGNIYPFPISFDANGLVPAVPPVGLNDYFKALIIYDITITIPYTFPVRYEFYVIDRDFNKSNVQVTPWIYPDFTGVITDTNNLIID